MYEVERGFLFKIYDCFIINMVDSQLNIRHLPSESNIYINSIYSIYIYLYTFYIYKIITISALNALAHMYFKEEQWLTCPVLDPQTVRNGCRVWRGHWTPQMTCQDMSLRSHC